MTYSRQGSAPTQGTKRNTANRGSLFMVKDKKKDTHPDFTGRIEIDDTLLTELQDALRTGGKATISLAGWKNSSPDAGPWISLSAKLDKPYQGRSRATGGNRESKTDDFWN